MLIILSHHLRCGTCLVAALALFLNALSAQADQMLHAALADVSSPSSMSTRAIVTLGGTEPDVFRDIVPDGSGGIVVVGGEEHSVGDEQSLIMRFDRNLNFISQRNLGGGNDEGFFAVSPDGSGGFVAAGVESSSEGERNENDRGMIARFDGNLNLIVQRTLGSGSDSSVVFKAITPDGSGRFIVVGYVIVVGNDSSSIGRLHALVARFDENLTLIDQLRIDGSDHSRFFSAISDGSGGFIVVGSEEASTGTSQALIAHFDENLSLVSQRSFGGDSHDYLWAIAPDGSGGFIAAGNEQSSAGTAQAFLAHFDGDLNLIAQRSLGGDGYDYFRAVIPDGTGGFIATGYETSSAGNYRALIARFDENLNLIAQRSLGGVSSARFFAITPDGARRFIVAGHEASSSGNAQALIATFPATLEISGLLTNHPDLVFSDPGLDSYDPSFAEPVNPGLSLIGAGFATTDPGFTADGFEVLRSNYP